MICFVRIEILTIVFQLLISYFVASFHQDVRNKFRRHAVIHPTISQERLAQKGARLPKDVNEAEIVKIHFEAFGKNFVVDLKENKKLFSPNYKEIYEEYEEGVAYIQVSEKETRCYYHGRLANVKNSWAAISTCDGISGIIFDGKETYYIEPNRMVQNAEHLLFKASDHKHVAFKCGVQDDLISVKDKYLNNLKVENLEGPYKSNEDSRYIEVVVISDYSMFEAFGRNLTTVSNRNKEVINIASAVLSPLNVFLTLQSLRVWMKSNAFEVSSNPTQTLNNFLKFRQETLLPHEPHDNAIFFTNQRYDDGVAGNAYTGFICTENKSGENVRDIPDDPAGITGTATAHEIGHNLGASHDDNSTNCRCPDEYCVMFPFSTAVIPTHWSTCSQSSIQMTFTMGKDSCIRNKPTKVEGPSCGNGYLEQGEECDCGIKEFCDDPHCDATSCRRV